VTATKPVAIQHDDGLRYRPRHGEARDLVECFLQILWRWRVELALAYIVATISVALLSLLGIV
jgi:hypothetical protein